MAGASGSAQAGRQTGGSSGGGRGGATSGGSAGVGEAGSAGEEANGAMAGSHEGGEGGAADAGSAGEAGSPGGSGGVELVPLPAGSREVAGVVNLVDAEAAAELETFLTEREPLFVTRSQNLVRSFNLFVTHYLEEDDFVFFLPGDLRRIPLERRRGSRRPVLRE